MTILNSLYILVIFYFSQKQIRTAGRFAALKSKENSEIQSYLDNISVLNKISCGSVLGTAPKSS